MSDDNVIELRQDGFQQNRDEQRRLRKRLSKGRESVMGELKPPIADDDLTIPEVCDYFLISRSGLINLIRKNEPELESVGYKAGVPGGGARKATFSRRAMLHIAMMLRPSTSERGLAITDALGLFRDSHCPHAVRLPQKGHVKRCGKILERATQIAENVQELDPTDVWDELDEIPEADLRPLLVALAALVPLDDPAIWQRLNEIGRPLSADDANATGLSLLMPSARYRRVVGE